VSAAPRKRARRATAKAPQERYHHGDLRRALVEETVRLIEEQDVGAVSLREVARRIGVTRAAPYHHFPDKAELLAAVAEDGFRDLQVAVQESLNRCAGQSPAEWLAVAARAYIQFATTHAAHYRAMFLPEFRERERFALLHEAGGQALDALVALVSAARPGEPVAASRALAVACWSSWHGYAMLANNGVLSSHPDLRDTDAISTLLGLLDQAVRTPLASPQPIHPSPAAPSSGERRPGQRKARRVT
jgi:AcrR family transcriptional regulator